MARKVCLAWHKSSHGLDGPGKVNLIQLSGKMNRFTSALLDVQPLVAPKFESHYT